MKVVHIITGLETGGAETMLYRLLSGTNREEFDCAVISLTDVGPVGERIRGLGVSVEALGMRRGIPDPRGILRLSRRLRELRPDAIQTWMYQADLIGGVTAKLASLFDSQPPVAWGIHSTHLDPRKVGRLKRAVVWLCARTSRSLARRIVCCSEASREFHARIGYDAKKMCVIPNGADLETFHPDLKARVEVRRELGVSEDAPLVGLVARFDPQKDHRTFIEAAKIVSRRLPKVCFVLCGDGVDSLNHELRGWMGESVLRERAYLLGRRSDIPRLTAALDVSVSSSAYGEAWPLIVGEAMACGVPCAVTNVGDSAEIVGETGRVVPPGDSEALAGSIHDLLTLSPEEKEKLGLSARRRVEENFGLREAIHAYEDLYRELGRAG